MTLPTFLGIGVPRGGTTWLHTLLATHPDVYMPTRRKEIRFFDRHFDRGLGWYEGFFCDDDERDRYRAIGEISPQYLYCGMCPDRIEATLPGVRLIAMLRHPVERAYSQYGFVVQRRNYHGSFEEFLDSRSSALERGFYGRYLSAYLRRFATDRILVLASEAAFADLEDSCRRLADFLEIAPDRFATADFGTKRVNASSVPRAGSLAGIFITTGRRLRRWQLEPIVDLGKRVGVHRFLFKGSSLPPLDPAVKKALTRRYEPEFDELEKRFGVDLSGWRA